MLQQRDFSFIYRYFIAEKQEGLVFLLIGIAAVLLGISFIFFFRNNPSLFKGMAIPLIAVGLIQIVVGYTVYSRSDRQKADVAYQAGTDPAFIKAVEIPRMEKVMKNFSVYRYTEIGLTILGIALFVYFRNDPGKVLWKGLGITLALQAIIMLAADGVAEKRGALYKTGLQNFIAAGNGSSYKNSN